MTVKEEKLAKKIQEQAAELKTLNDLLKDTIRENHKLLKRAVNAEQKLKKVKNKRP